MAYIRVFFKSTNFVYMSIAAITLYVLRNLTCAVGKDKIKNMVNLGGALPKTVFQCIRKFGGFTVTLSASFNILRDVAVF